MDEVAQQDITAAAAAHTELGRAYDVPVAEFGVRGRCRGDVLLCHLIHAAKLYRDCPAANGSSGWCGEAR